MRFGKKYLNTLNIILTSISNNKKLKTKVKIRLIRELMPQETVQYVADVLKISRQAVHRHL